MATPHVVGAAALVLGRYPSMTPRQVTATLLANAVPDVLRNFNIDYGWRWDQLEQSVGTPNLLLHVGTLAPSASEPPNARITVNCAGLRCTLDGSASDENQNVVEYVWRIEGRGVMRGRTVEHTFLGPIEANIRLTVFDAEQQSDTAETSFQVTGTPIAPCTACAFESGILPPSVNSLLAPSPDAIYVTRPSLLSGWLSAPYVTPPYGIWQKLSLHFWTGTTWQELALTDGSNQPLSLRKKVVAPGYYAWRIESSGASAKHYLLWYKTERTAVKNMFDIMPPVKGPASELPVNE